MLGVPYIYYGDSQATNMLAWDFILRREKNMLFNSYIFIFLFFPFALVIYFLLNRLQKYNLAKLSLVLASLLFYGYFNPWYLFIIISSILINFLLSRLIGKRLLNSKSSTQNAKISGCNQEDSNSRFWLIVGIIINIGIIFYFKYFDFFIENINSAFGFSLPVLNILMPLGISFFTLQQVSYLVDSYRGETRNYSFLDYALFVSFFPQLIAGPIVLHDEMIPQFKDEKRKQLRADNLMKGLYLFAMGLGKKVLIADTLALAVDYGYSISGNLGFASAVLVAVAYSFQIYFDFSGYCDMAYGIAKCFNIDIPINFNSPYKAVSIGDFWKRWHMSLTRFLTKYIYIPLGGNRKGTLRTLINILIVFLISGIWHGAGWTFIVWGIMHGIGSVIHRLINTKWSKLPKIVGVIFTFIFVTIAWIFFRAENITVALTMLKDIFCPQSFGLDGGLLSQFSVIELTYIEEHVGFLGNLVSKFNWINMAIIMGASAFIAFVPKNNLKKDWEEKDTGIRCVFMVIVAVWSILSLAGFSKFIYFNF